MHQRVFRTQQMRMPHGTAHDAAQNITPPLIGRQHAICNEEPRCAQMVGNDPVRCLHRAIGVAFGQLRRFPDQGFKRVGIIIVVHALQHRCNAFQPHARINGGTWQIGSAAIGCLFKLHEHKVPDFDEAVAIFIWGSRRPTCNMFAMIPENLAARAARPGIAHRPKIVAGRNADDPAFG